MRKYPAMLACAAIAAAAFLGTAPAHANTASPDYPAIQYGTVHSYTTGGNADVSTTDGGLNWCFNGNCRGSTTPLNQTGQVHSYTTGLYAAVYTHDGGYDWVYNG